MPEEKEACVGWERLQLSNKAQRPCRQPGPIVTSRGNRPTPGEGGRRTRGRAGVLGAGQAAALEKQNGNPTVSMVMQPSLCSQCRDQPPSGGTAYPWTHHCPCPTPLLEAPHLPHPTTQVASGAFTPVQQPCCFPLFCLSRLGAVSFQGPFCSTTRDLVCLMSRALFIGLIRHLILCLPSSHCCGGSRW